MKNVLRCLVLSICILKPVNAQTLADVYDENFKVFKQILATFVGKTEQDIVNYMGIPTSNYKTKNYKYLEYITHTYKYVESNSQFETDCKILIKLKKDEVVAAYALNNHNYCFQGNMLDLGAGF